MQIAFDKLFVRIVLAEDDVDDQLLFKEALDAITTRTHLTIASDGKILMDILRDPANSLTDIIFLDMKMPCLNGIDCLTQIKKNELLKNIPCIVFSTSSLDMEKAYKEGANLYVVKPGKFEDIIKFIEIVLSLDWKDYCPPPYELFLLSESSL